MPFAVIPQTTYCSTKTSTFAPFVVEFMFTTPLYVYCTAVAIEHIHNSHMTIGIEHVNDYP